jgi:CBS domain-containing protein
MSRQKKTKVREIMAGILSTAEMESTIEEIATMMKEEDVAAIPVIDEDGELMGVVTDRDIVVLCIAEGHDASECRAEDIIRVHLKRGAVMQSASPEMDEAEAALIMSENQLQCLPVLEKGRLVGMISWRDIEKKGGKERDRIGHRLMPRKKAS